MMRAITNSPAYTTNTVIPPRTNTACREENRLLAVGEESIETLLFYFGLSLLSFVVTIYYFQRRGKAWVICPIRLIGGAFGTDID
jgi:hypothetical protein